MLKTRKTVSWILRCTGILALLLGPSAINPGPASASTLGVAVVSSSQWGPDSSGYEHIVGEVQNTGTATETLIEINLDFYNSSGVVIGSDYTFTTVDPLAPGEKSPFEDIFTPPSGYASYSITSVTPSASSTAANRNFGTAITSTYTDSLGYRNIAGTITNWNTTTADSVEAVFTFYNSSGVAVAQNYAFVSSTSADIGAQQNSTFDESLSPDEPAYTSYAIIVQSISAPTPPPAPAISSITPASGSTAGGTIVTITGNYFDGISSVDFGSVAADSFTVVSPTQITAVAPAGTGTVAVTVTGNYGSSTSSPADTYLYAPPPSVTSVSPSTATTDGGTTVTITGSNLGGATAVDFGAIPASSFTIVSAGEITAVAPAQAAGQVAVTVTTPGGTSALSSADLYTYAVLPPVILSVSPSSGPLTGGTTATIMGTNFDGAGSLLFGSTPATNYTVVSDTQITATVPASATSGITEVTVTTPSGTSATTSDTGYLYLPTSTYTPLTPYRICDTRPGAPANQCNTSPNHTLGPNSSITIQVSGTNPAGSSSGGIPTGAVAAMLNVTVTNTTAASYLSVYPTGVAQPYTSNLNWVPGETVPNLVEVPLGQNGQVTIYNYGGSTDVIVDVQGYYATAPSTLSSSTPGLYVPLTPYRVCDTRSIEAGNYSGTNAQCIGKTLQAGGSLTVQIAGTNPNGTNSGGVPTGAAAVVLNVTVVNTTAASYLSVLPTDTAPSSPPDISNLNWVPGEIVPNRVVVPLSGNGNVTLYNNAGSTDVIVDVAGYYTSASSAITGSAFDPMSPARICDTRATSAANPCQGKTMGPNSTLGVQVTGGVVPSSATAVVMNVTVTNTTAASYLSAYPTGATQPTVSDLNWTQGETVPNLVVVKTGTGGEVNLYNYAGSVDVIADEVGYYM